MFIGGSLSPVKVRVACTLGYAAPMAEVKVIGKLTSVPDEVSSHQLSGAFVDLLNDVSDIGKFFACKTNNPIPSKNNFSNCKTLQANDVNLGRWLRKFGKKQVYLTL